MMMINFNQNNADVVPLDKSNTPLYGPYRYVQLQRMWFFSHFGQKLSTDFDYFCPNRAGFCTLVLNWAFLF